MRKLVFWILVTLTLSGVWFSTWDTGLANSTTTSSADTVIELNFEQLGLTDHLMRGPYDSYRVRFSPPSHWKLSEGATLILSVDVFYNDPEGNQRSVPAGGATLDIELNSQILTSILLNENGKQSITVDLPLDAFSKTRSEGRHELLLFLDAAFDCDYDYQTTINIQADSRILLPHTITDPTTDLRSLPRPFYQENTFVASETYMVVPDQPSAAELQSALTVQAGFARLSSGKLTLPLLTESQLSSDISGEAHLIFVGKPESFKSWSNLPNTIFGNSKEPKDLAKPDDGVVQMAVSPWNNEKVIFVVSGESDTAIIKGAQAVSSGLLRVSTSPVIAIVADVQDSIVMPIIVEDRAFGSLGYEAITTTGIGTHYIEYLFYIPPGQITKQDSYLDFTFTNSAMVNDDQSGIVVNLNDQTIGSIRFSDQTTQISTVRVSIPPYAVRSGSNKLLITTELSPNDYCSELERNNLWVSFSPASLLHLPLQPAETNTQNLQGINSYPLPFTNSPTLESLLVILPSQDSSAWGLAAQIAADLGLNANGTLIQIKTAFGDSVSADLLMDNNILVLGRASSLPIMNDLNPTLPAPFDKGSDQANEREEQIIYQLPSDTDLGYLQWVESPWNSKHIVLVISGSTPQGLKWAAQSLIDPKLNSKLSGNLVVIQDLHIYAFDLHVGSKPVSTDLIPPQIETTSPQAPNPSTVNPKPGWLLPGIILSSLLTVVVLVIVVVSAIRKKS